MDRRRGKWAVEQGDLFFLGKAMGGHMPMAQCFTIVQTTVR